MLVWLTSRSLCAYSKNNISNDWFLSMRHGQCLPRGRAAVLPAGNNQPRRARRIFYWWLGIKILSDTGCWRISSSYSCSSKDEKMDIEFSRPIRISLDVVETDERLPSVKFKFEVESNAFSESFLYRGEVWIACKDFDIFNHSLGRISCHLTSLDGLFLWKLCKDLVEMFFDGFDAKKVSSARSRK